MEDSLCDKGEGTEASVVLTTGSWTRLCLPRMRGLWEWEAVRGTMMGTRGEEVPVATDEEDRGEGEAVEEAASDGVEDGLCCWRMIWAKTGRAVAGCCCVVDFTVEESPVRSEGCLEREEALMPVLVPTGCPSARKGRAGIAFTSENILDSGRAEEDVGTEVDVPVDTELVAANAMGTLACAVGVLLVCKAFAADASSVLAWAAVATADGNGGGTKRPDWVAD